MSETPPTSRRPLPPNRPRSNRRLPAWRSPRKARWKPSRPPGPRQSGGTGILIENENATGSGISTGNAAASANSARSSPKNHAGDQEDQPNRLILTSLPAAPSEPGFPSHRHPPTRTSLKSEALIAPRQACPRHTGRRKSARRPSGKDSQPTPSLAGNHVVVAGAAGRPLPRRHNLPPGRFPASRKRILNSPRSKLARNGTCLRLPTSSVPSQGSRGSRSLRGDAGDALRFDRGAASAAASAAVNSSGPASPCRR